MTFEKKELPLFSVITPNYNDGATLGQMIESIFDQNYPQIEMIVVDDGSTDNSKKVLKDKQKKFKNLKVILGSHKGACFARNLGAKEAKGKYLSFLPADAILYPGVLRNWVNHLEDGELDFLYGGYRFVQEDTRQTVFDYMSEPLDPYFLKTNNYIDGSFPLKRELFEKMGGWDTNIKSLQDWDFWLNAILNHNAKGLYIPEVFFETTIPHEGGLSDDSMRNWTDRTNQIKRKHNIAERKMCVTSKGAEYHAKKVAKLIGADYKFNPDYRPHNYDLIYSLGFYPNIANECGKAFLNCKGLRVIHWIGSDVWQLLKQSTYTKRMLIDWMDNNIDLHLTEFKTTHDELKAEGINSKIVPIPPSRFFDITPLPKKLTVAVYQPRNNGDFYYPSAIDELTKKCRDVDFKVFGNIEQQGVKGNVTYMGRITEDEMAEVIKDSTALLRLVVHDGLSINAEEFFTAGRKVLTNIPNITFAVNVGDKMDDIVKAINDLKKLKQPDTEAARYWRNKLNPKKYKKFFDDLLKYDPKKYWEKRAECWDSIQGDHVYDEKQVVEQLKKLDPKSILDVGCGNGNWTKIINKEFPKMDYLGVDISVGLIKKAKENNKHNKFVVGDVRTMKLPKKYDLAFAYTCFLHVPPADMEKTVENLKTLAKRIIFIEPTKEPQNGGFRALHPELLKEIKKGNLILHPKYSNIHDYDKYFNIKKRIVMGDRTLMIADL